MTSHSEKTIIEIEGLEIFAHHGLLPEEREVGQLFRFDIRMFLSECPACESDDIAGTVDYAELSDRVAALVSGTQFQLLERLADALAQDILQGYPLVDKVKISAIKTSPPMAHAVKSVSVTVRRSRGKGRGGHGAGNGRPR